MRCPLPSLIRNRKSRSSKRSGTAVVELAVCTPLLVTIIFGSIQAASLLHVRNALESSAHHGSLLAIKTSANESGVISEIENLLTARGIHGATATLAGINEPFSEVQRGEQFEVLVTAPVAQNFTGPTMFLVSSNVEARIRATKQ